MKKRHSKAETPEFVYGLQYGHINILPKKVASDMAAVYDAFKHSRTWGEFKSAVSADEYAATLSLAGYGPEHEDEGAMEPAPTDPFKPYDVLMDAGDYWPPHPGSLMLDCLPEGIAEKFGRTTGSPVAGPYLEIPLTREAELVAALEAMGCKVTRDDSLFLCMNEKLPQAAPPAKRPSPG